MRFEMGGTEEQRLLVVTMKRMCPTEPMAVFDHHGSMLYANTVFAHMVGYDVDKMAGMKISKLMAEPYGYLHHRWIREQVRGGQGRGREAARALKMQRIGPGLQGNHTPQQALSLGAVAATQGGPNHGPVSADVVTVTCATCLPAGLPLAIPS